MAVIWSVCVLALLLRGTAAAPPASTWRSRLRERAAAGQRAPAATTFVPSTDAAVTTVGRTIRNGDGSQTFDWEGTNFALSVSGASFVKVVINTTGNIMGLFSCDVDGFDVSSFYVGGGNGAVTGNTFVCASDLHDNNRRVRLVQTLEPAFSGANEQDAFTFLGFETDGTVAAPAPRTRNIELLGDSISAGYGAKGRAGTPTCYVDDNTSGNRWTYNWALAEFFNANIVPIAWSGKGMYENCCDNGETMPSYYLQTLGGRAYTTDWDFSRFTPDMFICNLGTNDFGHDSGPAWEAAFSATYAAFIHNVTTRYNRPKLPIFVAQGPMNCRAPLNASLQVAIAAINAAGGNAHYLNLCGPPNDGCGGAWRWRFMVAVFHSAANMRLPLTPPAPARRPPGRQGSRGHVRDGGARHSECHGLVGGCSLRPSQERGSLGPRHGPLAGGASGMAANGRATTPIIKVPKKKKKNKKGEKKKKGLKKKKKRGAAHTKAKAVQLRPCPRALRPQNLLRMLCMISLCLMRTTVRRFLSREVPRTGAAAVGAEERDGARAGFSVVAAQRRCRSDSRMLAVAAAVVRYPAYPAGLPVALFLHFLLQRLAASRATSSPSTRA